MRRFGLILLALLLLSVGGISAQDDGQSATTSLLQVVDSDPLSGEELGANTPISVYFDRALDCSTVSDAADIKPAVEGAFECGADNNSMTFTPAQNYQLATEYIVTISTALRGADGSQLAEAYALDVTSTGFLQVSEVLPEDGSFDVATRAVVTVIFNRPVVALGTVDDMEALPNPLTFSPAVEGSGEWLSTSIYTFRPEPAWAAGQQYTVTVRGDLQAIDGARMAQAFTYQFTTGAPELIGLNPADAEGSVRLDAMLQVTFNTQLDQASIEQNFYMRPVGQTSGSVSGTFEWNIEADTGFAGFAFTPDDLLALNTTYELGFPENSVFDVTGQSPVPATKWQITTVPNPAIINTDPNDGQQDVSPFGGVTLYFASPMDQGTLDDKVTIDPEPWREPDYYYQTYNDALTVSFPTEPSTDYTITVAPGMADIWGNTIDAPFTFSYRTEVYSPDVSLQVPGPVGFYNGSLEETQVFITHRNVSLLDLSLYSVPLEDFARQAMGENSYDPTFQFNPRSENLLRRWQIESVAPENAQRYELLTLGGEGSSVACQGALPSRVKVGDTAIVTTEPDPLRARDGGPDGEVKDLLYRDYVFPIVGGPICSDGIVWWEAQLRDDSTAWVAEGVGDEYFMDLRTASATTPVDIPQALGEGALPPGIYYLEATSPETDRQGFRPQPHFLVVATANLTMKTSIDGVTVWATDVNTGLPIVNKRVAILDRQFNQVAAPGVTDADGIAHIDIPTLSDLYVGRMAAMVDDDYFGVGLSTWSDGIDPWQFGLSSTFYPQEYSLYLYTDRPVYRPDQPVYFRGVLRSKNDVTYSPSGLETVPVQIYDNQGSIAYERDLPLTEFGTFSDTFNIAADAPLGFYNIRIELPSRQQFLSEGGSIGFGVAEYRTPEFQVDAIAAANEVVQGDTVSVEVDSRYFFGGAVADATVDYNVIASPYSFNYSGPGRYDFTDFDPDGGPGEYLGFTGGVIASGSGTTNGEGKFTIEVPADLKDATQSQTFTVEATVRDVSDQTVSGRTDVIVHQGNIYIGARPENYVSTEGDETTVNLIAVDWESNPVANQDIDIEVVERRWSSVQEEDPNGRTVWTWEVEEIPVTTGEATTNDDGRASFVFTPPNGGIFKVTITSRDDAGNDVRASTTMWVSSREYISWRQQNSNRIDLIADNDSYQVGDTAEILITSPFQGLAEALITVERGDTLRTERVTMDSNSYVYSLPITADFVPNVYVSVMLVKGVDENNPVAGFRMGMVQLGVDNSHTELAIEITPDREQAGPRDTVTYTVRTTDYEGDPVRAEVGVGLTDLAALSVGSPNSGLLLDFFYGQQGISVRTASPLTINTDQITQTVLDTIKGGGGGFGEGGIFDIRQEFVDTAYWNAALITDENGVATFDVTLPDNLTTWRLDVRAVTDGRDGLTLVGQDTFDLLSTKPLLIRPVTPRFFVVGDQLILAAVVNNNTDSAQSVEVSIEGSGLTFTDDAVQVVTIPAGGQQRVNWRVTVENVENIDLTFFARSQNDEFGDASKPPLGQGEDRLLPVYKYEAPEITGTGGILREAGSLTEGIALPRRFDVTQGELTINLEPSLAATAIEGFDYLRAYSEGGVEAAVGSFLPNVMTVQALRELGIDNPALSSNLDVYVQRVVQRLYAQQHVDGGWGWYVRERSDSLVTAYAVIGLVTARDAGYTIENAVINRAVGYLQTQFVTANVNTESWRLDRQAFVLYALAYAGSPDAGRAANLFDNRERLSIYAKGFLARTLNLMGDNEERIETLLSDLFNTAIVSANGTHWEEAERDYWNWNTNTRTTAIVLGTLVQLRPDSDLIPNVVRWLMVARTADAWQTTQETAWAVMALTDWMVVTNELQANYGYTASFNGDQLISASATPENVTDTQTLMVAVADMMQDDLNRLTIERTEGAGNLYYTAYLRAFLPVPEIESLNRGIIVERRYTLLEDENRESITSAEIGDVVQVRLTIVAPNDLHYVVIDDPIPAGAEAINPDLETSQQVGTRPGLDSANPLQYGWGWWWFSNIEFRDEKVVLSATYLPAGTYEYVYTIRPGLEGVYNVIPPTGREFFFPDVFGRGDGSTFTVLPVSQ